MNEKDLENTIFVGNLHRCVTEEILFELFLQAGPIEKVHICRNGQQSLYGLVFYKHSEAVPYAVKLLNGIRIYGQPIGVQCQFGGSYQDNNLWCAGINSEEIANSKCDGFKDNMAFSSLGVENHTTQAHGWSDMPHNRYYDMCLSVVPTAVWYSPPLQQWIQCGYPPWTFCLDQKSMFLRSPSSTVACANREPYDGRVTSPVEIQK